MLSPTPASPQAQSRYLSSTHTVENVSRELLDYNMYTQDQALREAVVREGAAWAEDGLQAFGGLTGSADYLELGVLANRNPPELDTHDRFGHRVDLVRFHPAYHQLMRTAIEQGRACEDGIYSRLIRKYYATERPLIADIAKLQRLVRANSRAEKQAVVDVLEEFFHLEDDGWHQDRCDEVIAAYLAGEPEREVKKANEDNRLKRHREERARLFKLLTDAGQHAPPR